MKQCSKRSCEKQDSLQSGTIRKVTGDGAYEHLTIFNDLEERRISSSINIRSNTSRRSHGSPYRAECAREFLDAGYPKWVQTHDYGARWAIEGVFSAMKRIFDEPVKAASVMGIFHELRLKFWVYNLLMNN